MTGNAVRRPGMDHRQVTCPRLENTAMKKKTTMTVTEIRSLAEGIFSMKLRYPEGDAPEKVLPGQFAGLYPNDPSKLLPRPISICRWEPDSGELQFVFRVAGAGTASLAAQKTGDKVDMLGILGNGYDLGKLAGKRVLLLGGGIGIPPMVELAAALNGIPGSEVKAVMGYRDSSLFLTEELKKYGNLLIATEDGSVGTKGNVLDAVRENGVTADAVCACGMRHEDGEDRQPFPCTEREDLHGRPGVRRRGGGDLMREETYRSKPDMTVNIAGVELKNPVMTASGTFGSGMEYSEFVDLNHLGAVVTKGVANKPWEGNPTPRVAEVYGGMLNAIGLQNPGIDVFIERDLAFLKQFDTKVIVNVCGHTEEEYLEVVERLADEPVDMLEINVSCPNVKQGAIQFGQDPGCLEDITAKIKRIAKQPVIMKLTPNVTDISVMARAAEAGGADAISLINTITGMKIDIEKRRFVLANRTGGLSGPAIKPVAVRMVWQAAQAVKIPIIGMGGIASAEDAVEFMLAGASAVAVGAMNFHDPYLTQKVVDGMEQYLMRHNIQTVRELTGAVQ